MIHDITCINKNRHRYVPLDVADRGEPNNLGSLPECP